MLMGGPIKCLIHAANGFEWPCNYSQKALPMFMSGPIIFTIGAATDFGWAHDFFGSFQCIWVGLSDV